MRIEITEREKEILLQMLNNVNVRLDAAEELLLLRKKILEAGENKK